MKKKKASLKKCVNLIKKMCAGSAFPSAYVISGSGQKKITDFFKVVKSLSFSSFPGFGKLTVKGHSGKLQLCRHNNRTFLLQCGRNHLYERGSMEDVLFPILLVKELGLKRLLLLNSAGAVNRTLCVGDMMLITDQINLMFRNALFADPNIHGNERFVSMRPCYEQGFIRHMRKCKEQKRFWKEGVYAGVTGPVYETEAELKMLEKIGADVVGMSTVQEALYARFLGLQTTGISVISNARKSAADHNDVIMQSEKCLTRLCLMVRNYLEYISKV